MTAVRGDRLGGEVAARVIGELDMGHWIHNRGLPTEPPSPPEEVPLLAVFMLLLWKWEPRE